MSKPVIVNIPHDLGRAEARRRLEKGFAGIGQQLGGKAMSFSERWEGDRLLFEAGMFGQKASGRVDVLDDTVRIEVDLPWVLAQIADKVRGRLEKASTLLLEKK